MTKAAKPTELRQTTLRALLLEDSPQDVKLLVAMLERAGYSPKFDAVDLPDSFQKQLEQGEYDVIISDYNLRSWTAMEALEIFKKARKDIPFIVVSGSLGDEVAVECIKRGATDYILKDRMARLPLAVRRALEENALRQERQRAEEALRLSEERYRLLFESNPQPMWVFDQETLAFLAVNEAAVQHYGYSQQEFLSMTIKEIRPPEEVPGLLQQVSKPTTGLDHAGEWRHRKKDGTIIIVQITSHALVFGGRRAELVMATDVTERKRLEEQFRQSQKMEAVGQLAGGVAHDFNNLITIISGYCQLLLEGSGFDNTQREYIKEIKDAGDRAAALTRQLLAFSRRQILQPMRLDLNSVVNNMEKMVRRLIGEDIELVVVQRPGLWGVKADPGQIEQILMNLAINSRDAMPQGGKLTIETANVELDDAYARRHAVVAPGRYVMLAVSDTGIGMDAETQAHVFEPFFTTKEPGKGTGLGLSTVYGIVKQSGGHIWIYSEPGKGATFKVYLPRLEEPVEMIEQRKVPSKSLTGTETVLLVEDEERVRRLASKILESGGYRVLVAADPAEAMRICQEQQGTVHLLLTDVVMPQMSGREVAKQLIPLRNEMKVLYTSGYTDDAVIRHGMLEAGIAFLQKPFTRESLLRKVREVLDS